MPNITRPELAGALRRLACECHWLDQKPGSERQALDKVADLVATASLYQTALALEIADTTCLDDSSRPDDS
jgi:hypothetical protein